jgi:hypothetical protein
MDKFGDTAFWFCKHCASRIYYDRGGWTHRTRKNLSHRAEPEPTKYPRDEEPLTQTGAGWAEPSID